MIRQLILTLNCFGAVSFLHAQSITIKPYLQNASPNDIYVRWETDEGTESTVEWGLTTDLGSQTSGVSFSANGGNEQIHEVHLEDLQRFTQYYYRVITGTAVSETYTFKTPPFASDEESFRVVAMSDMQRDGAFPDKFREVVEDGVMDYLEESVGGEITDNLALIMIPGDLVVDGNNFGSWQQTFFQPSEELLSRIPVYPVPGNHENDASYYFSYFRLPENGTAGFEEHWWHKDYGNVRMIGLDSNGPYNGQDQLDWLDGVLNETCTADSIDFVFAQLHHPHKSELWTPGETGFSGEVVSRLEQFSSNCGKPSIHFFGHTHGYSRGQSRDHKHLWINVATAGGAIDNWGEFPNFDYPEFSKSLDEYGFVMVEITAGEQPELVVKRLTRGDQDQTIDNQVVDSLVLRLTSPEVNQPNPIFPVDVALPPECVELHADEFGSENPDATHGQSHWQVDLASGDFSNPIAESWKNFENWYFDIDTQAGDDLTDEVIPGLQEMTDYIWRVRYRDKELNWSAWSSSASFSTTSSITPANLLQNPGAEEGLTGWTVAQGIVEPLLSNECNGVPAYQGDRYFGVGGLCTESEVGVAYQDVDVAMFSDSIDAEVYSVSYGGYLSNYAGDDLPELKLIFQDEMANQIEESPVLSTLNSSWTSLFDEMTVPSGTRTIRMELKGTRNAGTDNDSYMDALYLGVGQSVDCDDLSIHINEVIRPNLSLNVFPNPTNQLLHVSCEDVSLRDLDINVIDLTGRKCLVGVDTLADKVRVDVSGLKAGTYVLLARDHTGVLGRTVFVVE